MAQEKKQTRQFSVEGLKKLIALTSANGDFLTYRTEIEKMQNKLNGMLSSCRESAENTGSIAQSVSAPVSVAEAPASRPSAPVAPPAPEPAAKAPEAAKEPAKPSAPAAAPAAGIVRKRMDNIPSYVKGMVSLRQEPPKRPRTSAQSGRAGGWAHPPGRHNDQSG